MGQPGRVVPACCTVGRPSCFRWQDPAWADPAAHRGVHSSEMLCFVFWRFGSWSCRKLALSASHLHAARSARKHTGQGCSRARVSCVMWPHSWHGGIFQSPSLWLEKGSCCCLAKQLGAVEHPSPPAPCTAEVCDQTAGLHPTLSLPAVLVAWGIHWASLSNCRPFWGAWRCSLPYISSYHPRGM